MNILSINNKILVCAMGCFVALLVGVYLYCLQSAVFNVAERAQLESKVASLNSQISSLEFSYITLKNKINLDLAHALGFKDVSEPIFVSRKAPRLSLNTLPNTR